MAAFKDCLKAFISLTFFLGATAVKPLHFGQKDQSWSDAHATFYGDMTGKETMRAYAYTCPSISVLSLGGACGYGDLFKQGYGLETAALSTVLFNNGVTCGACFDLKCVNDPQWCIPNAGTVTITGTNFCPSNYTKAIDVWCNPPRKHFDLSMPMFTRLANYKAGVIPVQYRRVMCSKRGGVQFQVKGNPYWTVVLPYNVGGSGDITNVKIKGSETSWIQMSRNWGVNWQTDTVLTGQSLSFQVTTSDGKTLEFDNVAPTNWQFYQVFDGKINF